MMRGFRMKKLRILYLIVILLFSIYSNGQLKTPREFFGFEPGTDRMLFNYEELIRYLQQVDDASGMVKMVEIGQSPMGKPRDSLVKNGKVFFLATLSMHSNEVGPSQAAPIIAFELITNSLIQHSTFNITSMRSSI